MESIHVSMESVRQPPKLQVNMYWFYGVMIAGVLVWVFQLVSAINRSKLKLPPGPPQWPLVGNLLDLGKMPHHAMTSMSKKYGDLIYLKLGVVHAVVVSSPDMAKEFLKVQDSVFSGRPSGVQSKLIFYDSQGLILSVGDHWRFLRKLSTLELFSPKRVKEGEPIRREEILSAISDLLEKGKARETVKADPFLIGVGFNNITRLLFNETYYGPKATGAPEDRQTLRDLIVANNASGFMVMRDFIPWLGPLDLGGTEAKMKKNGRGFDAFLSKKLEEHRAQGLKGRKGKPALVDVLLQLQQDGDGPSEAAIKALLMDMLLAGSETAAGVQAWALTELMRHPEARQKLLTELDTVVGRDRVVEEADLVNLKYLQAVVKETFRLHPVLPFLVPHESMSATKVAGYDIPEKTRIFVNTYGIGRDPRLWNDPLSFNPDRFFDNPMSVRGQSFELLPFGSGRRICVGLNLSMILIELNLAQILHTCELFLPPGVKPEDIDVEEKFGEQITTPKAVPLEFVAAPRLPSRVYKEAGILF
ncbi:hypothetical protein Mapa_016697 [Marchantia paleacea]|nr:hypothetical protein Mapa_016697 [Marchantia paleacea]